MLGEVGSQIQFIPKRRGNMHLKDLAINHDYYCNDSNYYSNDARKDYETWKDFYNEFFDADIDMNLIFRFDIYLKEDDNEKSGYGMKIYMMHQRKGKFAPYIINSIEESDVDSIIEILSQHYKKIQSIWSPFPDILNKISN